MRSHEDVGGPLTYLNTCANVNGELFGTEVGEVETVSRVAVRVSREQFVVVEKRQMWHVRRKSLNFIVDVTKT